MASMMMHHGRNAIKFIRSSYIFQKKEELFSVRVLLGIGKNWGLRVLEMFI
jgi:hypothetical protein